MEDSLLQYLKYYEKLPQWIKYPAGILYSSLPPMVRYGTFYSNFRKRIDYFLHLPDHESMINAQQEILFAEVNRSIKEIPFYQQYDSVRCLDDFHRLPVVSKADYLKDISLFCSSNVSRRLKVNTGGSSGTPLTFYLEKKKSRPKEKAFFDWFWGNWGYRPNSRILMLRGKPLTHNALYEYQSIKNCLNVSCYELTPGNASTVLKEIQKFKPQFIHAYPSAVDVFVRCIGNAAQNCFSELKALFLGSEFLDHEEKNRFESFFQAPACAWYGHTECALLGGALPRDDRLLFFPFYGFFELLDDAGNVITQPGVTGRIVGTSFDNSVMPFIRYDTGDRGTLSEPVKLGNFFCPTLARIDGRAQDLIYLQDGAAVSLTAFIFGQHFKEFDLIREMQIEQRELGSIVLRIVPLNTLTEQNKQAIKDFLEASVSNRLKIQIETVKHIEKTLRGKHRFLIQHYHTHS